MHYFFTDIVNITGESDANFEQYILDGEIDTTDHDNESQHNKDVLEEEEDLDKDNDDEYVIDNKHSDNEAMDDDNNYSPIFLS